MAAPLWDVSSFMGLAYHDGQYGTVNLVAIPYEQTGRRSQKSRTRAALVAAARELLAAGQTPTVEAAAAAAAVSRTTAYRYFPNQRSLIVAAHPEIDRNSLLPDDPPDDPEERLALVAGATIRIVLDWEAQLRASLRLSLEPGADPTGPVLRQGRVIGWLEEALSPLSRTHPHVDRRRLAVAIRAATGIEAFVWMVDVAGLSRDEAAATMQWTTIALLRSALRDGLTSAIDNAPRAIGGAGI
jgi:AcrR family transcriptional regulator